MSEIITAFFHIDDTAGVDVSQDLSSPEWRARTVFYLPRIGFQFLSVISSTVATGGRHGVPTPRLDLIDPYLEDGQFAVEWLFPDMTSGNVAYGNFFAAFYRD